MKCLKAVIEVWKTTLAGREFHWDTVRGKKEFRNWVDRHFNGLMAID